MKDKFYFEDNVYKVETGNNIEIVFSSNKIGDIAFQGDNKDNKKIIKSRQKLADVLKVNLVDFVWARQNHTANIAKVTLANKGRGMLSFEDGIDDVDGLYTFEKGIVLCAYYADCTPVYVYSERDNFISVIHAGWQGTMKSIVYKAISSYINDLGIKKENLKVIVGPSIGFESFEVENDVIEKLEKLEYIDYKSTYKQINSVKYLVDIKKVNSLQAQAAGVDVENIIVSEIDTFKDENLYSFRKNQTKERMCACIIQK